MVKTDKFILRYANCWEDADLLVKKVNLGPVGRILSICSGGDNSLSLLTLDPEEIVVVDINPLQLYLLELKMAAIKALSYEKCLEFLGFLPGMDRVKDYERVKIHLSVNAQDFWNINGKMIQNGVVLSALLERNLRLFAKYYRPLIHGRKKVDLLLSRKDANEQKEVYESQWNTLWWRILFGIFFSKASLKMIAPDPDFFNYVDKNVGAYLFGKTTKHFSDPACQQNPFLHYALNGHFANCLPHAWKRENYNKIKSGLHKIKMHCGFAEDVCKDEAKFDVFNLSNIFEYTTSGEFSHLASALHKGAAPNARFFYWNILLPRKLSDELPLSFRNQVDTSKQSGIQDHGWIYNCFIVDALK